MHVPRTDSDSVMPGLPDIHPSFIQVAKPYVFEQTIQDCIKAMGVNPIREESLRLQGVLWIDNVRKVLHLYVQYVHLRESSAQAVLIEFTVLFALLIRL